MKKIPPKTQKQQHRPPLIWDITLCNSSPGYIDITDSAMVFSEDSHITASIITTGYCFAEPIGILFNKDVIAAQSDFKWAHTFNPGVWDILVGSLCFDLICDAVMDAWVRNRSNHRSIAVHRKNFRSIHNIKIALLIGLSYCSVVFSNWVLSQNIISTRVPFDDIADAIIAVKSGSFRLVAPPTFKDGGLRNLLDYRLSFSTNIPAPEIAEILDSAQISSQIALAVLRDPSALSINPMFSLYDYMIKATADVGRLIAVEDSKGTSIKKLLYYINNGGIKTRLMKLLAEKLKTACASGIFAKAVSDRFPPSKLKHSLGREVVLSVIVLDNLRSLFRIYTCLLATIVLFEILQILLLRLYRHSPLQYITRF